MTSPADGAFAIASEELQRTISRYVASRSSTEDDRRRALLQGGSDEPSDVIAATRLASLSAPMLRLLRASIGCSRDATRPRCDGCGACGVEWSMSISRALCATDSTCLT